MDARGVAVYEQDVLYFPRAFKQQGCGNMRRCADVRRLDSEDAHSWAETTNGGVKNTKSFNGNGLVHVPGGTAALMAASASAMG